MEYVVELTERAARDLNALYKRISAAESIAAADWYNGLAQAVGSLERSPRRGPRAPESENAKRFLRHLLYGKKPHVYRAIYEIDERQRIVRVLAIRHGGEGAGQAKGAKKSKFSHLR
jgi:toxin ParE1/3/4